MTNRVVLGLQWGDEGKGKVIDALAGAVDLVVRCQGGANAGHTVVHDGRTTILHLLPSGALHAGAQCIIGNGVVVDPGALRTELADLRTIGVDLAERLHVSDRAHLVLPWHRALDAAHEALKGDAKVGTTLRGIGPTYATKMERTGIRCGDVRDRDGFVSKAREQVRRVNKLLDCWQMDPLDDNDVVDESLTACDELRPFVRDTVALLHREHKQGRRILFEGAQGVMLDIDHGTYPFVTSSNTGTGGVITGSGLSHKALGEVIGIVKAYTTRVGAGSLPTELQGADGDALREKGGEFGATTGRPRRCGWLDLVVVDFACRLNGVDTIALTKLDVLQGYETIKVCVGYRLDGALIETMPAQAEDLARAEPIYEELPGFTEDISGCRALEDLPTNARDYVRYIEERSGVRIGYIGVGPSREQTIVC